jgi:hypothetical protein
MRAELTPANTTSTLTVSTPTVTLSALFEIREIPGKGKGMVAAVDIPKGTRIIAEEPLILIAGGPGEIMEARAKREYDRLSPRKRAIFDSLHVAHPDSPNKLMAVFDTNSLPAGLINGAVYENISMINHSCNPNGYHSWNANIQKETIHATRDIPKGEEITITYGIDESLLRDSRRVRLKRLFAFDCMCTHCDVTDEQAEASNVRRLQIAHLSINIEKPDRVHVAPDAVLSDCNALGLIREVEFGPGHGYTAATHYDALQVAVCHGRLRQAKNYATLAYRARLVLEGEDSPETQRMKGFMNNPRSHYAWGMSVGS